MKKTIGIVAEFNPFHNGHAALIATARARGYTHCIAVMSGNFVQRAQPAIADKRVRTHAALLNGANLIFELPLAYATATAQHFAMGAVQLLAATGCVDALCFGSESGDADALNAVAQQLDSAALRPLLQSYLQQGISFAHARTRAVEELFGLDAARLLCTPNNLLAVEYLRAARQIGWQPEIVTMPRVAVAHDSSVGVGKFASASLLRGLSQDLAAINPYIPSSASQVYKKAQEDGLFPCSPDKLDIAVLSHLRRLSLSELSLLPDLSEGIQNRLYHAVCVSGTREELYANIKTKRYPLSRVRRLVLSAFLGLTKADLQFPPPYLRILGFDTKGRELLARMKATATLPFGHKLHQLATNSPRALRAAQLESSATDQFALGLPRPLPCGYEHSASAVFLK